MFRRKNTGQPVTGKVQNGSRHRLAKRYSTAVRTLIIGCGYVGEALGQRLIALGHTVTGVRRESADNDRLAKLGIRPLNLDITQSDSLDALAEPFDHVVVAVSSSRGGREAHQRVFGAGIVNVCAWLKTHTARSVVFISSTSVYRQTEGEWVDEKSHTAMDTATSKTLRNAEDQIASVVSPVTILRSSGIYGPGRGYLFQQFMKGAATIEGTGERFLNMVHRDDLAKAIIRSFDGNGGTFNITDDEPVSQLNFFEWLSERTNRPLPPFAPEPDPSTRKRGITNKRVSNKRFKEALGFEYTHPTFREGLETELRKQL